MPAEWRDHVCQRLQCAERGSTFINKIEAHAAESRIVQTLYLLPRSIGVKHSHSVPASARGGDRVKGAAIVRSVKTWLNDDGTLQPEGGEHPHVLVPVRFRWRIAAIRGERILLCRSNNVRVAITCLLGNGNFRFAWIGSRTLLKMDICFACYVLHGCLSSWLVQKVPSPASQRV